MTIALLTISWTLVDGFPNFLGGANGLDLIPQPLVSLTSSFESYQYIFLGICAVAGVATFIFCERFVRSPLGRAARAIRENESAATTLGINPAGCG